MSVIHYGMPGLTYGAGYTYGQDLTPGAPIKGRKMIHAALKLEDKTLDQKMQLSVDVGEGITANAARSAVTPSVLAVKTIRDNITAKRAEIAATEALLKTKHDELDALDASHDMALTNQCNDVIRIANHDRDVVDAANIPLRKEPEAVTDTPPALENLTGSYGDLPSEIDWQFNGVKRRATYVAETAPSPDGPWTQQYVGTRSRFTTTGHASGDMVYGRVKCICNGFHSPWSQVAAQRAT